MNIKRSLKCIPIKNILFLLKHASTQIEKFLLKKMVLVGFKKDIGLKNTLPISFGTAIVCIKTEKRLEIHSTQKHTNL